MTDVSVGFRPPCWCPSGWAPAWRLHTNLYKFGKKVSSHISQKKNCCDLKLGESLCIFTFFRFSESGLYLLNGFDFYFSLLWMAWHWKPAIVKPHAEQHMLSVDQFFSFWSWKKILSSFMVNDYNQELRFLSLAKYIYILEFCGNRRYSGYHANANKFISSTWKLQKLSWITWGKGRFLGKPLECVIPLPDNKPVNDCLLINWYGLT